MTYQKQRPNPLFKGLSTRELWQLNCDQLARKRKGEQAARTGETGAELMRRTDLSPRRVRESNAACARRAHAILDTGVRAL